jgi:hypothetical protein
MLTDKTPTDVDVTLALCHRLERTIVLVPSYNGLEPHTEACIEWMRGLGARVIHSTHCPDVALHRCLLATSVFESMQPARENSDREWVLWLDSDISIEKLELWLLFDDSDAMREACPGLEASVSARYLTKLSAQLSAVRAQRHNDIVTRAGKLQPVYSGLGCFLSTAKGFMRHCRDAAKVQVPRASVCLVCTAGPTIVDGALRWQGEDWSYCAEEWRSGAVYLSRARARHSRVVLTAPDDREWAAGAVCTSPPESPADSLDAQATPTLPDAPETSR